VLSRQKRQQKYFIMLQLKTGLEQYSSKHLKKKVNINVRNTNNNTIASSRKSTVIDTYLNYKEQKVY